MRLGGARQGGIESQRAIHGGAIDLRIIFEDGDFVAAETGLAHFGSQFLESESAVIGIRNEDAVPHALKKPQLLHEARIRPDVAQLS